MSMAVQYSSELPSKSSFHEAEILSLSELFPILYRRRCRNERATKTLSLKKTKKSQTKKYIDSQEILFHFAYLIIGRFETKQLLDP